MKVLIIEDEFPAAKKLERYLKKYDADIHIEAIVESIQDAVEWLTTNQESISLIFMDVQLTDGLSFEIFSRVQVTKPLIFTTAYDEYAIDAFKLNSIDYLLKPLTFTNLSQALKKLTALKLSLNDIEDRTQAINVISKKKFKDRFLIKLGNNIQSINSDDVAYFYAEGRTVYLITTENKKTIIDYRLQNLEEILDPEKFYRVNRSYIINYKAIENIAVYSNSRLKINANPVAQEDIIVSREKVRDFKVWLDK